MSEIPKEQLETLLGEVQALRRGLRREQRGMLVMTACTVALGAFSVLDMFALRHRTENNSSQRAR
jgi:hypothetical protein